MRLSVPLFIVALALGSSAARAEEVVLYGAGSLKSALTELAKRFSDRTGIGVRTAFGPSGLMREKIEAGDPVDVFASADMGHPLNLRKEGKAAGVALFTRNSLCAFAKPDAGLTTQAFAEGLTAPAVKLGTSTPGADPGGDYTWAMFRAIDKLQPGAFDVLDRKAQKIVGGTTAPSADPDPIASAFASGTINVMIGYCSGAADRVKATPGISVVPVPLALTAGPEYGLALLSPGKSGATLLAFEILSPEGQAVLKAYGFSPPGTVSAP